MYTVLMKEIYVTIPASCTTVGINTAKNYNKPQLNRRYFPRKAFCSGISTWKALSSQAIPGAAPLVVSAP